MDARSIELREPSASGEIAAIFHETVTSVTEPQSTVISKQMTHHKQCISILSRNYEPLHYILFFPNGTAGWGLSDLEDHPNLSQIAWYRSCLYADNDRRFTSLRWLTCEYLIDMYLCAEEQQLSYIAREWEQLIDHTEDSDEDNKDNYQLLASFIGSQSWASEQMANSMALGKAFGKPTFFCTMMFNPNWPEIWERLRHGQSASDLPFIIGRVFKACLEKVLHILRTCFGEREKKYLIKVIGFQKRGFPHAHILIKVRVIHDTIHT